MWCTSHPPRKQALPLAPLRDAWLTKQNIARVSHNTQVLLVHSDNLFRSLLFQTPSVCNVVHLLRDAKGSSKTPRPYYLSTTGRAIISFTPGTACLRFASARFVNDKHGETFKVLPSAPFRTNQSSPLQGLEYQPGDDGDDDGGNDDEQGLPAEEPEQ